MENYVVSARKYRPSTFATVVGQHALTATLKSAIASERLAHAYLFTGSRGIGKTSCARIFAKTINCTHRTPEGEACNECESCRAFNNGTSLNILELDAASHNGVDDIKAITDQVIVPPVTGKYKVFIIDEVHMLSSAAFNAFLKTLEEPPSYVIFILATTEKHKIIPTILSRCQIYDFARITVPDIVAHLQNVAADQGITAEPAALNVIARKADGAMRDALSIFDQVAASSRGNITYQSAIDSLNILDHAYYSRLLTAFLEKDVPQALLIYKEIRDKGFDSLFFINGLGDYLRDIMVASSPSTIGLVEAVDDVKQEMAAIAQKCSPQFLYQAMAICNDADLNYRQASNKQFFIELELIRLCQQLSPSSAIKGKEKGQKLKPIAVAATGKENTGATAATPDITTGATVAEGSERSDKSDGSDRSDKTPRATAVSQAGTLKRPGGTFGGYKAPKLGEAFVAAEHKQVSEAPRLHENFTDQAVQTLWDSYIEANAGEHVLRSLMTECRPARQKEAAFTVEADSEYNADYLRNHLETLLPFMRKGLRNDDFSLEIKLVTGTATAAEVMSEREALGAMMEKYPYVKQFVDELHLALE